MAPDTGVPRGSVFDDGTADAEPEAPGAAPPEVDLYHIRIEDRVLDLLPTWLVRQYLVIPIRLDGNVLTVAMRDPADQKAIAAIIDHAGLEVRPLRADEEALLGRYTMHYRL